MSTAKISNKLFIFITRALKSRLDDFKLTATLIQGIRCALELLSSTFKFKPELGFQVFLDAHAEDVRVYRKYHLLSQCIELSLFALDYLRHLCESLLELFL